MRRDPQTPVIIDPGTGRRRFGDWLVSAGELSAKQHELVVAEKRRRPFTPFGQLAVEMGFVRPGRLEELLTRYRRSLPIGELLVREGRITRDQLAQVVRVQEQTGERLGEILVRLGHLSEEGLCEALARQYDLPFLHLKYVAPEPGLRATLNPVYAAQNRAVPVTRIGRRLTVAIADPTAGGWLEELARVSGLEIVPFLTMPSELAEFYQETYGRPLDSTSGRRRSERGGESADDRPALALAAEIAAQASEAIESIEADAPAPEAHDLELEVVDDDELDFRRSKYVTSTEDSPIVQTLVQQIIGRALSLRASDIHLEADLDGPRLRLRVDGILATYSLGKEPDRHYRRNFRSVISRLKILCHLDITEKRRPQDGSFRIYTRRLGRVGSVDFRLSTLPSRFGEGLVIRVLDGARAPATLESLGLTAEVEKQFRALIHRPLGILLLTGPTGSGKSSTLYAALRTIYRPELKILTVEDPVEYTHTGIVQTEVNPVIDNTFARLLRAFLRQDPDVIMVGEIRDPETAEMAQRAAMTGHLLLSTLHTTCSTTAVHRLLDLSVDPNSLASTLIGVMSQRLVRRNCGECLEQYEPAPELLAEWFETPPDVLWRRGHGCRACHNTGYTGRIAVAELWVPSAADAALIRRRASDDEIREEALKRMPSLAEDALLKAMQGKTSLEEAARVAPYDDVRLVRERGARRVLEGLEVGVGDAEGPDGADRMVA